MVEIYALMAPDSDEIRYVGKANDSKARLARHIQDSRRRNTPVYCWIRKLLRAGKVPRYRVLNAYSRGVKGRSTDGHKKLVLNCMGFADLIPDRVPPKWHLVRWDYELFGDLNIKVIKQHMLPSLFAKLDFTGVFE